MDRKQNLSRAVSKVAALLLMMAVAGCGDPQPGNRSTRADADPEAFERAKAQAAQAEQEARAAEAGVFGDVVEGPEER